MDEEVLQRGYTQAEAAIARLSDTIVRYQSADDDIIRDAMIQRFEFSYELLWKLFRKIHILRGVERSKVRAAYECIAEAGAAGWLKDRAVWEQMRVDRNVTSHEYDMHAAQAIIPRIIADYAPEMQRVLAYLKINYIDQTPFDKWIDRAEKN